MSVVASFNKHHKASYHLCCKLHHHFWWEIWTIKVIKCPANYNLWRDIHSNLSPNLKITWIQSETLTPKLETGSLRLDLMKHFETFTKIECASNHLYFWTYCKCKRLFILYAVRIPDAKKGITYYYSKPMRVDIYLLGFRALSF